MSVADEIIEKSTKTDARTYISDRMMKQAGKSPEEVQLDLVLLRHKVKRLKNGKADLELLIHTNLEHSNFI